ncbi:hypothetical protein CY34DRAFT_757742 [Suillus luteus UH-Slu-Lm8-n1]|uniref:Uncharacterized protein n=1 Tax=Suillus luteus UH-Slu-Lm8-n1 TaxID=930992 RepID=A0A0D0AL29_9AGAM|nr:hypothetical protein CY34DRAFT_757742 [Suillus luteus UH-Slu-Lm8-n1]
MGLLLGMSWGSSGCLSTVTRNLVDCLLLWRPRVGQGRAIRMAPRIASFGNSKCNIRDLEASHGNKAETGKILQDNSWRLFGNTFQNQQRITHTCEESPKTDQCLYLLALCAYSRPRRRVTTQASGLRYSAALLRIVLVDWLLQGPGLEILGCLHAYDIQRPRLPPLTWQV